MTSPDYGYYYVPCNSVTSFLYFLNPLKQMRDDMLSIF